MLLTRYLFSFCARGLLLCQTKRRICSAVTLNCVHIKRGQCYLCVWHRSLQHVVYCWWHLYCSGSCEPGSRCHPNECIFEGEKPRGVRILESGVYEQGKGNGEVSLQANGDQGGRILSQLGGFQVSEADRKGEQGELARGDNKARGMCHVHCNLCSCI